MLNNESILWDLKYEKSREYSDIQDFLRFCDTNPTLNHILPYVRNTEGFKILEIGSGTGELISYVKNRNPKIEALGLDFSEVSIKRSKEAVKRFDLDIDFILGDIKKMPFPDNFFDIVFGDQVIGHIGSPDEALNEIYRVTKKGGLAAFSIGNALRPDGWYLHTKISKNHEGYKQTSMFPWVLNSHIKRAGFQSLKFYGDMLILFRTFFLLKNIFSKPRPENFKIEKLLHNRPESGKNGALKKTYHLLDGFIPPWFKVTIGILAKK